MHGLHLSQGTLRNIPKRAHQYLEQFSDSAKAGVSSSEVVHFDETGMRVVESLHWFHVASTDTITCYFIHPRRGTPAMKTLAYWAILMVTRCMITISATTSLIFIM